MTSDWEEKQHTPLHISCYVDGNPPPTIRLIRGQGTSKILLEEQVDKWLIYAIESSQCYDSDNYICAGSSSAFNSSTNMFKINVLCKNTYTFASKSNGNKNSTTKINAYFIY